MQRVVLAFVSLCTKYFANSEETCGKWLLPKDPVHFSGTHTSQWRLLATAGQTIDGTPITGVETEKMYPTVIRGHWAIGELEFYADPECKGDKYRTLREDNPQLAPLQTTYGWQDDAPVQGEHPFLLTLGSDSPWYSEMRAIDGCSSSEFWSACYQCDGSSAWYGVRFDTDAKDVEQIKCVKIFQKDADAYTATKVELQRWFPNSWNTTGDVTVGVGWGWQTRGTWTGLNGGSWYLLKDNTTKATAGAHGGAVPSLLGLFGFLLWTTL